MALGPFYVADKLKGGDRMRGIALFMRHGETAWNREGRVMGRNPIELDAQGRAQVEASVPFARLIKPELIVTSPLARARQSAEIIAAGVGGVPIAEDPQLSEVQYGRWEGMVYDDLLEDEEYLNYRDHPLDEPTPGGETIAQVQSRGVEAVRRAISRTRATPDYVRLARRYHPHRVVPFHAASRLAHFPANPRGQRGVLRFSADWRFRRD